MHQPTAIFKNCTAKNHQYDANPTVTEHAVGMHSWMGRIDRTHDLNSDAWSSIHISWTKLVLRHIGLSLMYILVKI